MNNFNECQISTHILDALAHMNYATPTKVQAETIPKALKGKDLIVLSKTGSGKTAAFGIPILQQSLCNSSSKSMILAPTRELALQIQIELKNIASKTDLGIVLVYGKHSMEKEISSFKKGFQILIGTPGRIIDHLKQGNIKGKDFERLVLDEADRMLDMGFLPQVDEIISHLDQRKNTLLFSATIPDEISRLAEKYLQSPEIIELSQDSKTVDQVNQQYYRVSANQKRDYLLRLIAAEMPESCMIFCNQRREVDRVCSFLADKGVKTKAIHGANSQSSRIQSLNQFRKGKFPILVATDVAARGIHVENLELVINYDLPIEKDSYVHRVGRTGRAGKEGKAISLVGPNDLFSLYEIEEHVGVMIDPMPGLTDEQCKEGLKKIQSNQDLYGVSYREVEEHGYHRSPKTGRSYKKNKSNANHKKNESGTSNRLKSKSQHTSLQSTTCNQSKQKQTPKNKSHDQLKQKQTPKNKSHNQSKQKQTPKNKSHDQLKQKQTPKNKSYNKPKQKKILQGRSYDPSQQNLAPHPSSNTMRTKQSNKYSEENYQRMSFSSNKSLKSYTEPVLPKKKKSGWKNAVHNIFKRRS